MPPRPILKPFPMLSSSPGFNPAHANNDDPHFDDENLLPFTSSSHIDSPHVHFPPTPMMTKVLITHSRFSYDRKPIEVLPNTCALPERGERKVTSVATGSTMDSMSVKGESFHPRAYKNESTLSASTPDSFRPSSPIRANHAQSSRCARERDGHLDVPPLVFDISSESDSDMCGSPPTVGNAEMSRGASHISVHFSGSPTGPSSSTSGIPGIPPDREEGYELRSPYRGSAKKPRSLRHNHSEQSSNETSGNVGLGMDTLNRTRSRTKRTANSTRNNACRSRSPGSGTSFYEPGLEGCLGGF